MTSPRRISRTPWFWIVLALISALSSWAAFRFFPSAFPIVHLDVRMSRTQALSDAAERDRKLGLTPAGFREAIDFDLDEGFQNYVELAAGGPKEFARLLEEKLYSPYAWKIRHYLPGEERETRLAYTPEGVPYGFSRKVPETEKGASLAPERARALAEAQARADWALDLSGYKLLEQSKTIRPSGRSDYELVYELEGRKIGEATLRVRLAVAGDRLSGLSHYAHVPESFTRRYAEMRSSNKTIATFSTVAMALLYFLGGCGIGLLYLTRHRWVLWKPALAWALGIGALQFLDGLNKLPLAWMGYDTAVSPTQFVLRNVSGAFASGLFDGLLLAVSFMAAEGLTRRAFPRQPQLWRTWSPAAAGSPGVLGRTLGGYLAAGCLFGFVTLLYAVMRKWFGWWNPSEALFHPDVLAVPMPWLTAIASSLHAGFWEESLFRAVPLACAALIGDRLGGRGKWLVFGFILQALVFASAHASYPAQPAYARVIELIVPSCVFAAAYLGFGLLPGIVAHFTFDVVWFALPLFSASLPRIWVERAIVVALALVPLWLVLATRIGRRRWSEIPAELLNGAWSPALEIAAELGPEPAAARPELGPKLRLALAGGGLLAIAAAFQYGRPGVDTLRLETPRPRAIQAARDALAGAGYHLGPEWRELALTEAAPGEDDRFVWKTSGPAIYHALMGSYLPPPDWKVRFVRWDGGIETRAEEYQAYVERSGEIQRVRHVLPESAPGVKLDEAAARTLAEAAVRSRYRIDPARLKPVSASPEARPDRVDWVFVWSNPEIRLKEGEARLAVRVMGKEVAGTRQLVHVPELWQREDRARLQSLALAQQAIWMLRALLFLAAAVGCAIAWGRGRYATRAFLVTLAALLAVSLGDTANELPGVIARFTTSEPYSHQFASGLAMSLVFDLLVAGAAALLVGHGVRAASSPARTARPWTAEILPALGLGLVAAGAMAVVRAQLPKPMPYWGSFAGADSRVPELALLASLAAFALRAGMLLIVMRVADRLSASGGAARWLAPLALVAVTGFVLANETRSDSLSQWVLLSLVAGSLDWVIWELCRRTRWAVLPLVVAAQGALTSAIFASQALFPGAEAAGYLTGALVLAAGWAGYRALTVRETAPL